MSSCLVDERSGHVLSFEQILTSSPGKLDLKIKSSTMPLFNEGRPSQDRDTDRQRAAPP